MRILILSFYYPPDIGPGALRAKSIVDALINEGPSDLKIDVLTTMPNRYHSLNIPALRHEVNDKISINRFNLPKHKNRILDQLDRYKAVLVDQFYNLAQISFRSIAQSSRLSAQRQTAR